MKRFFAVAKGWENKGINLPTRQTKYSAGYDIEAAEDIEIPSIWSFLFDMNIVFDVKKQVEKLFKPIIVHTGVKVSMYEDEVFVVHVRSSMGIKHHLKLANGTGIIDSDYYNNPNNDGEIMIALHNYGLTTKRIAKGERIAQGVFMKYYTVSDEQNLKERLGGIGSTGNLALA
ncbi:dUTP diphosphatase [Aerococcaceae bacterium zg-B36]|uniref:dUTP diphosphatase n=1 Tax=Aerococcaceae bacterium zg-252 TaxID=2796928 RepID=UPI001BD80853|nr:dUTP diphosphatase [Aerococcaceae bacterium zg-B36]